METGAIDSMDLGRGAVYKAGYQRFQWRDTGRGRPVWADVWYPTTDRADEIALPFGLGEGRAIPSAVLAAGNRFPLVVLSHGASGSAANYSWLAEYLARHGVVVLGVSHYGESWMYGIETVDAGAVTRLWDRPGDCSFAITQLLRDQTFQRGVDPARIAALGHSSGGATVLALGGATLDPGALWDYCRSNAASADRGCEYARQFESLPAIPAEARASFRDSRVAAIIALDPAAGPGHNATSLADVLVPVLIVGAEDNDFLPFAHHAGHYAALLPDVTLIKLSDGEGHFVYLNSCTADLSANGVPLCADRDGVDRESVHAKLAPRVLAFLTDSLPGGGS